MGDSSTFVSKTTGKRFKTELTDYSLRHSDSTGPYADNLDVDTLIVGAGFSGVFMLKTLRERGFKAVVFEAGGDIGGTWRFNSYPGARVDSAVPEYKFSWPEVYKTWTWTTNYHKSQPEARRQLSWMGFKDGVLCAELGEHETYLALQRTHRDYRELRAYFDYVDRVVGIKKDCSFRTVVTGASFDQDAGKWIVTTADDRMNKTRFLILGSGFAAKRYMPAWPGMETFQGTLHHSSFWPDEHVDVRGKCCAIIGTGASGVQISQEWGPLAGSLKVFQRTPNLALPMGKKPLTAQEQDASKQWYGDFFQMRQRTFAGFLYDSVERNTFDDSPEEREAFYQSLWDSAGFHFWLANYKDLLTDREANTEAYKFWAKKFRARIGDPRKRDILAPLEMPHYFGIKRPCLEQNYYEQFNQETVDVIDVNKNPIKALDETGIFLEDGTHCDLDFIAVATGFDITGGMTQMGLKSVNSTELASEWQVAANTYLGATVSGYPNMFHMYGPHGPTLLSNGPSTVEVQGRWTADAITKIQRNRIKYVNATPEATKSWKQTINNLSNKTLFPTTRSTYMGGSVPGKAFEQVNYAGGIPMYKNEIRNALKTWEGFDVVKDNAPNGAVQV